MDELKRPFACIGHFAYFGTNSIFMHKLALSFLTLLLTIVSAGHAVAQTDKMYRHNGETANVKVIKVGEFTITFSYAGETAQEVISKYAVAKIEYASGRTEEITEKVRIGGKDDWEKVTFVEDKACTVGLKKVAEINVWSYGWTSGNSDKRVTKKIKSAAADKGGEFILVASEKNSSYSGEAMKRAAIYTY